MSRPPSSSAGVLDGRGDASPNVVALPRRPLHYATWADLVARYEPKPGEPAKVLAFAQPAAPEAPHVTKP